MAAQNLKLEITEQAFMDRSDAVAATLTALRDLGHTVLEASGGPAASR